VFATSSSGLAPDARSDAPCAIEIESAATTHSDGPVGCATIVVQLPVPTVAVSIVVSAVIASAPAGGSARHRLATSPVPKQPGAASIVTCASVAASGDVGLPVQKLPAAVVWQVWPLGQLSRSGVHGAPLCTCGA
jgi:hypothetical protein